jgi:replicative DNA helicase
MRTNDDALDRLRTPPHSLEAEQSVLGGLLLDNGAWDNAADVVGEVDFYRYEHRLIFASLGALIAANKPADVITVFEHLQNQGTAQESGGLIYLNQLAQSVPSAGATRHYADIVRERAVLRRLIAAGDEIVASAFNPQGRSVTEILDAAESKVLRVGQEGSHGKGGFQSIDRLAVALIDKVTERAESASDVVGTRTGFIDLDRTTTGLQDGDLIVLAARPSMGKTSLAMNIAENVAIDSGACVLVFSMEMGADQLTMRMIGSQGSIDQQHLRTGRLDNLEWGRLAEAAEKVSRASIHIDETPALTVADLRARARRQARVLGKVSLIVIDYLQLMAGSSGEGENRATELGTISRGLKALAKELRCPVVALSQLNRSVEARPNKRPMMSDLRESGAIEQDADVIMFIYRDEYYNRDTKDHGTAEIIIAKQRNGPTGMVRLGFQKEWTRFTNLERSIRYIAGGES